MKFAFSILFFSFSAFAFEESIFLCVPSKATNGLAIQSLLIHATNGKPDAIMTIQYEGSNEEEKSNMSYKGDDCSYVLSPRADGDGELSVRLNKQFVGYGGWTAHVSHKYQDTFSQLSCTKWQ